MSESPGEVDPGIYKVNITSVADMYKFSPFLMDFSHYLAPGQYYSSIVADPGLLGTASSIGDT